jgi:protein-S-isoprenylcysteine O-methyltransferase Ste14
MHQAPTLALALWNAWLLCLPMIVVGGVLTARRKDVARRLSSMTGYSRTEKLVTAIASFLPYPFMGLAVWTPMTTHGARFVLGVLLSGLGNAAFAATLYVFAKAPPNQLLQSGPYRLSRNPLYVSATIVFIGVCVATGNLLLSGMLAAMLALQHFMIMAEERACTAHFGSPYQRYLRTTPRYLGWPRG